MEPSSVPRISPEETRRRVEQGQAILVCGYASDEKCQLVHISGARTLHQFLNNLPDIPREQEIIFYCN